MSIALSEAEIAFYRELKWGKLVTREQYLLAFQISNEYQIQSDSDWCSDFISVYPEAECRAQLHSLKTITSWRLTHDAGNNLDSISLFVFQGPSVLEVNSILERAELDRTLICAPLRITQKKKGGRL